MLSAVSRRDCARLTGAAALAGAGMMAGGMRQAAAHPARPSAAERARATEAQMTDGERLDLIYSLMVLNPRTGRNDPRVPAEVPQIAGWTKGVARLGVPDLLMTDASLGITNPGGGRRGDTATALPSGLAMGASFNPTLAHRAGRLLGIEARSRGFNLLLGGGMNLVRDPRGGRNFEYISEDPLLTAAIVAESVLGTQAESVVSTLKHVSLNAQETNKSALDAQINPAAHRESDLLAFQIAIERANPGALMAAYNKVNGEHCAGNAPILDGAIKGAMGFQGFVMSDWKAVYHWDYALKGLDQHSGVQLDEKEWFIGPLREAYARGEFPRERLSDMVRRILWGIYTAGADAWEGQRPLPDMAAHHEVALEIVRQGIVLLKNEGSLLPITAGMRRIAVIGGRAHIGVAGGGGGSSLTTPPGDFALMIPLGGEGMLAPMRQEGYIAPGPLESLRKLLPAAQFTYDSAEYPSQAAALARRSDLVLLFATKPESEGFDAPDLSLPNGQDAVIGAVAAANPNTVVVLQTGNPVDMPWRNQVRAILQAWFPGQAGGQAIAEVLTGRVNPSGRLPVTFPEQVEQLPHPEMPGVGTPPDTPTVVRYHEGAEVGYRWFHRTGARPIFAFGHGLSYTRFDYADLRIEGGETVTASFTVTNTGDREGADVPQLYLTEAAGERRMRLLAFERVQLHPGKARRVELTAEPRLLARFDSAAGQWRIAGGPHRVMVGRAVGAPVLTGETSLEPRLFGR